MRMSARSASVALLFVGFALPLAAQGTLSTQGLGFPPGQLSTRANTMGGAIGEADPLSPLNPAAIGVLRTSMIGMQAEPEFRELKYGVASQRTSVARFPVFFGYMPVGTRWGVMVSASTLFDRTWTTTSRDSQAVGTDTVTSTVIQSSDGSVVDVRLAVSYMARSWLQFGLGTHGYTGNDALKTVRAFDDTARFTTDTLRNVLSFGGSALSAGALAYWPTIGAIGVTYRKGGNLNTYSGPRMVRGGSAPDHIGVSAMYLGIKGTTLGVRLASDLWSKVADVSPSLKVHEGLDLGLGADVLGPRFGGGAGHASLRLGARWRTLPFSFNATPVKERSWSFGFGVPLAAQRAELNFGVLRAARSGPAGYSENAWTISTGFTVRP
jgi:hypothetical protein